MHFAVEPLSEDTLLLRFGERIDIDLNTQVHAAARRLRTVPLRGMVDIAPAYASILLRFDPAAWDDASDRPPHARVEQALRAALAHAPLPAAGSDDAGSRIVEIPVCYGGTYGPDLEALAAYAGMGSGEVVARHAADVYTVAMLGFAPGFPYLLGLNPALHMPRRTTPRTRVPAGSVAIGGAQTGIYPRELPGGWNLIGRTPLALFDPRHAPPCLLAPADRVRFRAISAEEFSALTERPW
ncbi:MAG: 5-oxoprolinase subunit PxpB [Xanthomonadales bacterium]|nr:5-oxoprolinase subunit PxpB [Xanthomonadales bacterium]